MESPPPPPLPSQPAFAPAVPPPVPNRDADNLHTLSICHYVVAGLELPIMGFLALHYTMMRFMFTHIEAAEKASPPKDGPPFDPTEFFGIFKWFYVMMGLWFLAHGILTLISGRFIARRKNRTFSLVVAGVNCLNFPFGMILGIFTLIVLPKESVARLYAEAEAQRG